MIHASSKAHYAMMAKSKPCTSSLAPCVCKILDPTTKETQTVVTMQTCGAGKKGRAEECASFKVLGNKSFYILQGLLKGFA
jgi:hypothetical protein